MTTITFDTLKFSNTLKAAGVPPAQAEAEATVLAEVLEVNLKELVTKEDLRRDLKEMEQRLDSRFLELENKLVKWGIGLALGQVAVIAALVKLL